MECVRHLGSRLLLAGFMIGFLSCVPLPDWTSKFKHSEGLKVGDGGYSIALPPVTGQSGGRVLWFYGDTAFWHNGSGPLVQPPSGTGDGGLFTDPNVRLLGGNTIGISTWTQDRSTPASVDFYARSRIGTADCGMTGAQWNTNCPVRRVTLASDLPADWEDMQEAGGFIPKDYHPVPPASARRNWLKDAVYVANTPYPAGYIPPTVFADKPANFLAMGFIRASGTEGYAIMTGVESGPPTSWTYRDPVDTAVDATGWRLQFGNALLHVPGDDKIRIYGEVSRSPFDPYTQKDMVLAVAWPPTDLVDPNRWWYFYKGGTTPCPSQACFSNTRPTNGDLVTALARVAEHIVGDFSVDLKCYNDPGVEPNAPVNDCALILTHGAYPAMMEGDLPETAACPAGQAGPHAVDATNPRYFAFRTTKDDTSWPPLEIGSYGSAPASGQPDMRQSTFIVDWSTGEGWDQALLCGANGVREMRQVRAHDDISEDSSLAFSYYLSSDCTWAGYDTTCTAPSVGENLWPYTLTTAEHTEANRQSNLRFGKVMLFQLRPWCKAHNSCP